MDKLTIEQEVIDCAKRWAFHYGKSGWKHYDSAADKVRTQNETVQDLLDAVSKLNAEEKQDKINISP